MQPDLLYSPDGTPDVTNLLSGQASSIDSFLGPILILSTVLSLFFVAAYLASMIRRWKVERAILDIQKTLHEMNERSREQSVPAPTPIAAEPPVEPTLLSPAPTNTPAGVARPTEQP